MHQSLIPSIQWSQVFLCESGISLRCPASTAFLASTAMSPHLTYLKIKFFQSSSSVYLLSSIKCPASTAFLASTAMSPHLTYHWGLMIGSTMSLLLLQTGTTIGLSFVSLYKPFSVRAASTAFLASNLFIPANKVPSIIIFSLSTIFN